MSASGTQVSDENANLRAQYDQQVEAITSVSAKLGTWTQQMEQARAHAMRVRCDVCTATFALRRFVCDAYAMHCGACAAVRVLWCVRATKLVACIAMLRMHALICV
eukprot:6183653-Pleurochrysis_carterae.AAC.9